MAYEALIKNRERIDNRWESSMRHLLILRSGKNSIHPSWTYMAKDKIDIAYLFYDESDLKNEQYAFVDKIDGTKLTGTYEFFKKNPTVIESYDYFWLFEDDLFIPPSTIDGIIEILNKNIIQLSAPSLEYGSFFSHSIVLKQDGLIMRGTDFVECMAPIMHRDFLRRTLNEFTEFPLWGIERYWQHLLWEMREVAYIFDKWPIYHTRPLGGGSLYKNAQKMNISPRDDEERSKSIYSGKFKEISNILFAVQDNYEHTFLYGKDLKNYISSSERRLNLPFHDKTSDRVCFPNEYFSQFLSFNSVKNIINNRNISGTESNAIVREWSFGSITNDERWCSYLRLSEGGNIIGYDHENEKTWGVFDDHIAFYNAQGIVSTVFDQIEVIDKKMILTGKHFGDTDNILYLKEI